MLPRNELDIIFKAIVDDEKRPYSVQSINRMRERMMEAIQTSNPSMVEIVNYTGHSMYKDHITVRVIQYNEHYRFEDATFHYGELYD